MNDNEPRPSSLQETQSSLKDAYAEIEDWKALSGDNLTKRLKAEAERDQLRAEAGKLRDALERAESALWDAYYGNGIDLGYVRNVTTIIKQALSQPAPPMIELEKVKPIVEALDELMTVASECIDFDQENQVAVCHCCGTELDKSGSGHKHGCVANAVLEQSNYLTLAKELGITD